jgi:cob(I)alamin adenosyltransferase
MKIYTKTGDDGGTALFGGGRVAKSDSRVAAYGDVDELNAWLGVARAHGIDEKVSAALEHVQQDLFVVGAILATPDPDRRKRSKFDLAADRIESLEHQIDSWQDELPPLEAFVLPGGCPTAAFLHVARTVCRRAERAIVALQADDLPETILPYINRLSDYLFVCARFVNHQAGVTEPTW